MQRTSCYASDPALRLEGGDKLTESPKDQGLILQATSLILQFVRLWVEILKP